MTDPVAAIAGRKCPDCNGAPNGCEECENTGRDQWREGDPVMPCHRCGVSDDDVTFDGLGLRPIDWSHLYEGKCFTTLRSLLAASERRREEAERVIEFARELAADNCHYHDECPTFGVKHGACLRCKALRALNPLTPGGPDA